eukprot:COSAG02_NODE_349_length_24073_cov_102.816092_10_plen_76_part_00
MRTAVSQPIAWGLLPLRQGSQSWIFGTGCVLERVGIRGAVACLWLIAPLVERGIPGLASADLVVVVSAAAGRGPS